MFSKNTMVCRRIVTNVVVVVVVMLSSMSQAQMPPPPLPQPGPPPPAGGAIPGPPPPGGSGYPQVQSSHCRYLINAPSPWGINASPFKLYTRSYAGEVRRGYPVEVSILPIYEAFKFSNFTDFALWAEPMYSAPPTGAQRMADLEVQWGGGAAMPAPSPALVSHLGVWQVYPQYAGGAGSMRCNIYSRGEDTVGSFEERMLELLKTQFPADTRLSGFQPSARHGAAFLWYPDEKTLGTGAIKFVAKLKSFGQWFQLESTPWRVFRPPPPRRFNQMNFNSFLEQYSNMNQKAIAMERKMEQAGNGAL